MQKIGVELNYEVVGNNIKKAIESSGKSIEEIVKETGFSYDSINSWRTGRARPTSRGLYLLSKSTGVSMDDLMKGCDN